jgi:hypothetical protein
MKYILLGLMLFTITNANAGILKSDLPKLDTSYDEPDEQLTMCPDGSYVKGSYCRLCPDGKYVASKTCRLAPDGHYY